jgi:hypothetical protein
MLLENFMRVDTAVFMLGHCFRIFFSCYFRANMFLCRIFEQIIFSAKEISLKIFFALTKTAVYSATGLIIFGFRLFPTG